MAGIEMRYGHWGRANRCLAVHLCVVAGRDRGVVATQPDAAHGEPGIAMALRNLRFLQERKRSASGAKEDELCLDVAIRAATFLPDLNVPETSVTLQILDP